MEFFQNKFHFFRKVFNYDRPGKIINKQECRRAHRKLFEVFSLTSSEEEEDLLG